MPRTVPWASFDSMASEVGTDIQVTIGAALLT